MTIFKSTYDKKLYIVYKQRCGLGYVYICEDYFTKEQRNMSEGGRYSFITMKPIAHR
jgi:hypothetical protein